MGSAGATSGAPNVAAMPATTTVSMLPDANVVSSAQRGSIAEIAKLPRNRNPLRLNEHSVLPAGVGTGGQTDTL